MIIRHAQCACLRGERMVMGAPPGDFGSHLLLFSAIACSEVLGPLAILGGLVIFVPVGICKLRGRRRSR